MKASLYIAGLAGLGLLSACGAGDEILQGERFDVRAALNAVPQGEAPADALSPARALSLRAQVNHTSWSHRNGGPAHAIQHPALARSLTQAWSVNIGKGDKRKARITADPVSAGGLVYTLDSGATVSAVSAASGQIVWQRDMTPAGDKPGDASGGGLAVVSGTLYVTTGFGELSALDAISGSTKWVQGFEGPVQGAPTVRGDLVYVVSRDNRAFAVETGNGRLRWELPGTPTASVTSNGAAPAVTDRLVIFPFGAAELVATLRKGGIRVWGATLAGERRGRSYTGFTDISGDPVVVGSTVYAATPSGRLVALNANSGERLWTATEGALSPVWPAGGSLFLVSDANALLRLDASDGSIIWSVELPKFVKEGRKKRRRKAIFAHYGPVLAGGLLRVASDDGVLRSFDPASGTLVGQVDLPGGATTNPIVVGGVLYVVSAKGNLQAYR